MRVRNVLLTLLAALVAVAVYAVWLVAIAVKDPDAPPVPRQTV